MNNKIVLMFMVLSLFFPSSCIKTKVTINKELERMETEDNCIPLGSLGYKIGTYMTIEGIFYGRGSKAKPDFLVDTVNNKKLTSPIGIGLGDGFIFQIEKKLEGKRCIFKGYESGRWIGDPPSYLEATGAFPSQAVWQFQKYFIVTSIESPKVNDAGG